MTRTKKAQPKAAAEPTLYVGLDVHKETIAVAVAEAGRSGEVRFYGTIDGTPDAVRKLIARISKDGHGLSVCYEAGPCGYGIHRQLTKLGVPCVVIAPSRIPKGSADKIKTDRRDAMVLARLLRAGELTAVWVPDERHEALRDLIRARRTAKGDLTAARQGVLSFLLRQERRYPGKTRWTKTHWRWLGEQAFVETAQQLVFGEGLRKIEEAQARCDRLDAALEEAVEGWSLARLVRALQALRGVRLVIAATLVAEIGDITRFDHPKQLMSWLGLVLSERSSGPRTRRGGITKTGNREARTMLVEAAWSYRLPAREGKSSRERLVGLPEDVRQVGWKAQVRLCQRFRRLVASGKPAPKVNVAIARELAGFVWDIARRVPIEPTPRAAA